MICLATRVLQFSGDASPKSVNIFPSMVLTVALQIAVFLFSSEETAEFNLDAGEIFLMCDIKQTCIYDEILVIDLPDETFVKGWPPPFKILDVVRVSVFDGIQNSKQMFTHEFVVVLIASGKIRAAAMIFRFTFIMNLVRDLDSEDST
jgi:hypothetical protein